MHELPIIGEVVKVALRHAEQNQAKRIVKGFNVKSIEIL